MYLIIFLWSVLQSGSWVPAAPRSYLVRYWSDSVQPQHLNHSVLLEHLRDRIDTLNTTFCKQPFFYFSYRYIQYIWNPCLDVTVKVTMTVILSSIIYNMCYELYIYQNYLLIYEVDNLDLGFTSSYTKSVFKIHCILRICITTYYFIL